MRRWTLSIAGAVLVAHALAGLLFQPDLALHETRVEIARGLRWMRDNTPSPGPWNAPRAQPDWGVLAVPARGMEIAWEARRPAVFSEAGVYGSVDTLKGASTALRATSAEDLARAMHACGARYLVLTPLDDRGYQSVCNLPVSMGGAPNDFVGDEGCWWKVSVTASRAETTLGLRRVYASSRVVMENGRAITSPGTYGVPLGPAISIWELPAPERDDTGPQMRPR